MNVHSGARSCRASRVLLVQRITAQGWPVAQAAAAAGLSRRSAFKWLRRYRDQGEAGLADVRLEVVLRTAVRVPSGCRAPRPPPGSS